MQDNDFRYRGKVAAVEHHYYLVGPIGDAEDYLDLCVALEEAVEGDTFHIHINTVGGDLATVAQIIHHMRKTKAYIVTHAEGQVFSGGSLIFFCGHALNVGELSEFLAHCPSGGTGGKVGDIVDSAQHLRAYTADFYTNVYTPFYSEAEIKKVLRGKELYETAAQMEGRLIKAKKFFEEEEVVED